MKIENVQAERVQQLNDRPIRAGRYVLYWMQQSQRAEYNHALEYAIERANDADLPVLVVFGLTDDFPEANLRHYTFLLEGLKDVQQRLAERGIQLLVERGEPPNVALAAGDQAALIVCDRGYLRYQKAWREKVAEEASCRVVQVESDVVVPLEVTSDKAEYAARTIRPKIKKHWERWIKELEHLSPEKKTVISEPGVRLDRIDEVLADLSIDRSVKPVSLLFRGGTTEAKRRFEYFLNNRLSHYSENRNQPHTDDVSHMSMYLHFGHISPLYLALRIRGAEACPEEVRDSFLEELVIRRELCCNFVHYTKPYASFAGLPGWAQRTLNEHRMDRREHAYSPEQLENAETHDPYWNAAMNEMCFTGYLHNHMRMYWGKKILEWSQAPEQAYETVLALNNKYFLDGRDPNAYGNVGWIFGLHDRPWKERAVFGKIRYMSASGLERKCDIGAYVQKVQRIVAEFR